MTTYKTNHAATTKSLTEWYFGKAFVASMTAKAKRESKKTGRRNSASGRTAPAT